MPQLTWHVGVFVLHQQPSKLKPNVELCLIPPLLLDHLMLSYLVFALLSFFFCSTTRNKNTNRIQNVGRVLVNMDPVSLLSGYPTGTFECLEGHHVLVLPLGDSAARKCVVV